jgi:L-asparagine oxygenase
MTKSDRTSEMVLLTIARRLGQPVGYEPELGGELIQNILPVRGTEARQVSTSSKVDLMFHTEAAFHPHRPRYLVLFCLRGDHDGIARTTLSSIRVVIDLLPEAVRAVLFERRFRTAVDESYLHGAQNHLGDPVAVLSGDRANPTMVFDADLMVGMDLEAEAALKALAGVTASYHTGVVLTAGDALVVDNNSAVHGRTAFAPRFDGNDRWLQRTFVVADLAPSAAERTGRVINTRF